jgi:hypothetical protein
MSNEKQNEKQRTIFEGDFTARVVDAQIGGAKGKVRVRMEFEVLDGEHKGKRARYDGKLDPDNIRFTKRDMVAVGWAGVDAATFTADVMKAAKAIPITVEQASHTYEDSGKTTTWSAVRRIGGPRPLDKLDAEKLRDVNSWFAEAGDIEAPPAANGASRQTAEEDLPF